MLPEPIMPLWSQLAAAAVGISMWPGVWPRVRRLTRWTLRAVRGRAKAARQYRLGGIGRLRALWRAVDL